MVFAIVDDRFPGVRFTPFDAGGAVWPAKIRPKQARLKDILNYLFTTKSLAKTSLPFGVATCGI